MKIEKTILKETVVAQFSSSPEDVKLFKKTAEFAVNKIRHNAEAFDGQYPSAAVCAGFDRDHMRTLEVIPIKVKAGSILKQAIAWDPVLSTRIFVWDHINNMQPLCSPRLLGPPEP